MVGKRNRCTISEVKPDEETAGNNQEGEKLKMWTLKQQIESVSTG
jgi:hypothetical protein